MTRTPINIRRTYVFKDKDPVIDEIRTLLQDANMSIYDCERAGGPTATTLHGWLHGETRRPQHATVKQAVRTVPGYDYRIVKVKR